jgi:hypothetical protein
MVSLWAENIINRLSVLRRVEFSSRYTPHKDSSIMDAFFMGERG